MAKKLTAMKAKRRPREVEGESLSAPNLFPIFLKLRGRACLVIGGGAIAEGKIRSLLEAGAKVTVIAPEATETIASWSQAGLLKWNKRAFHQGDLRGNFLIVTATGRSIDAAVYAEAGASSILCNAVDDPEHCDFYYPAVVRRGALQIAISTAGHSPALAQRLRSELEHQFGPEYERWVAALGQLRRVLFADVDMDGENRRRSLHEQASEAAFHAFLSTLAREVSDGEGAA